MLLAKLDSCRQVAVQPGGERNGGQVGKENMRGQRDIWEETDRQGRGRETYGERGREGGGRETKGRR